MTIIQSIVLGIVQGLTEFLPISSSAHLVIVPRIFGWNNLLHQNSAQVSFDVVLHFGSLIALLIYFRDDLIALIKNRDEDSSRLLKMLSIGSIPVFFVGLFLNGLVQKLFSSITITSLLLLVTGAFILVAEYVGSNEIKIKTMKTKDSLLIGIAQAVAIAPGISRSGATISTGLILGLDRAQAARFSFLLAIPAVFAALLSTAVKAKNLFSPIMLVGLLSSFLFSYMAIKFLLGYLNKGNLKIFAVYCITAGIVFSIVF